MNQSILLTLCREEYKAYKVYTVLSKSPLIPRKTRAVLQAASAQEKRHYEFWKSIVGECAPGSTKFAVYLNGLLLWFFGFTVVMKLLEKEESKAIDAYASLLGTVPEAYEQILREEREHERLFMENISEERTKYLGSIALGVTDALIELTGILAGSSSMLGNSFLAGLVGLVAGFSASISMGVASYTQAKSGGLSKPAKAALYTTISYLLVSFVLVLPYFLLAGGMVALTVMVAVAIGVLAYVSFYSSVLRGTDYARELAENVLLVLGVALLLHLFGGFVKQLLGLEL